MSNSSMYIAAAGGMAQFERMEALSNNLANLNTTGYKADQAIFSVERPDYQGQVRWSPSTTSDAAARGLSYARVDTIDIDMSQGSLEKTDSALDIAIGGEGFFKLMSPSGPLYTRAGALAIETDGRLISKSGLPILGQGDSEIYVGDGNLTIDKQGNVLSSSSSGPLGQLQVVAFEQAVSFERVGMTMFRAVDDKGAPVPDTEVYDPQIIQGSLESSNVNAVSAMVEMIDTNRAFEQFQKTVQTLEGLEKQANDKLGRPV